MSSHDDHPPAFFLDPWLTAKGDALKGLSETIIEEVERKICSGLTQKARRDALARRRTVVENLTANFATLTLSPHLRDFGLLAVPTDKRKPTRYDREDYPTRLLSMVLDAMTAGGFIIRHPSVFKQRCTTAELKARAEEAMVEVSERLLGVSLPVKEKPIRIGREAVLMAAA